MAGRGRGRRGAGGLTCRSPCSAPTAWSSSRWPTATWSSRSSSTRTPRCCATCPRGPTPPEETRARHAPADGARPRGRRPGHVDGVPRRRRARDSSAFVGLYMLTPPHGPSQPKVPGPGRPRLPDPSRPLAAGVRPRGLARAAPSRLRDRRAGPGDRADHGGQRRLPRDHGLGRPHLRAGLHREYDEPVPGSEDGEVEYAISPRASGDARRSRPGPRRRGARPRPPPPTPPARPAGRTATAR